MRSGSLILARGQSHTVTNRFLREVIATYVVKSLLEAGAHGGKNVIGNGFELAKKSSNPVASRCHNHLRDLLFRSQSSREYLNFLQVQLLNTSNPQSDTCHCSVGWACRLIPLLQLKWLFVSTALDDFADVFDGVKEGVDDLRIPL